MSLFCVNSKTSFILDYSKVQFIHKGLCCVIMIASVPYSTARDFALNSKYSHV